MAVTKAKKKVVKKVSHGIAHVVATNNNTRITITDQSGAVLTWATAGANNFKGAKKSTPYAASVVADAVGKKVAEMGMKTVDVLMRGVLARVANLLSAGWQMPGWLYSRLQIQRASHTMVAVQKRCVVFNN